MAHRFRFLPLFFFSFIELNAFSTKEKEKRKTFDFLLSFFSFLRSFVLDFLHPRPLALHEMTEGVALGEDLVIDDLVPLTRALQGRFVDEHHFRLTLQLDAFRKIFDEPFDADDFERGPDDKQEIGFLLHVDGADLADAVALGMVFIVEHDVWADLADAQRPFAGGLADLRDRHAGLAVHHVRFLKSIDVVRRAGRLRMTK